MTNEIECEWKLITEHECYQLEADEDSTIARATNFMPGILPVVLRNAC
jgi:hypothetical protein